jgi:hypothetical protein
VPLSVIRALACASVLECRLSRATHRWSLQTNARRATVERVTIQRMEHVGIVVDDLAAATAFFVELGLKLQGEGQVEDGWVDRVVGLEDVRVSTRCWRPRTATDGSSW